LFVLGILPAGTVTAQVSLPVSDAFPSTGPELAWSDPDSSYSLVEAFSPSAPGGDGYVFNVNDALYWQAVRLDADDGSLGDYAVESYLYVPTSDGTNWGRVGIYGRAQGTGFGTFRNCYFFAADSDGDDYLRVGRYYNDGVNWDVYFQGSVTRDAWHKFRLELKGSSIRALLDDAEVYSSNNATDFTTGYFGILCYQQTALAPVTRADLFSVESLVEPTPTSPPPPTPSTGLSGWEIYR